MSKRLNRGISGAVIAGVVVVVVIMAAVAAIILTTHKPTPTPTTTTSTSITSSVTTTTPTVKQIGGGVIYSNSSGVYATFTLWSTGNVTVISATIVDTTFSASVGTNSITNHSLTAGVNTVTISFGKLSGLQPGRIYTIYLTLSDGQTVQVLVVAQ